MIMSQSYENQEHRKAAAKYLRGKLVWKEELVHISIAQPDLNLKQSGENQRNVFL